MDSLLPDVFARCHFSFFFRGAATRSRRDVPPVVVCLFSRLHIFNLPLMPRCSSLSSLPDVAGRYFFFLMFLRSEMIRQ